MPIRAENRGRYPKDWKEISLSIRARARGRCEQCGAENGQPHPDTDSVVVLTVAHLNHGPEDCRPENLRAWCQRCHLNYDRPTHVRNAARTRRRKMRTGDLFP